MHDTKGEEKIIVYNMAFESTRLKELAEQFPDLSKEIQNRIDRIVDLMVPFRERQYYHRDFQGKYSIKVVAPIMSPEISYDKLVIQNGSSAMQAFAQLHKLKIKEQYKIRQAYWIIVIPMC
ncbi:MAG: DUF2779 domain-containing protein [Bacteroidetes bacterium]|nr:DUF2779 domain-containing protein [Bacteroidota bacterium]